MILIPWTNKTRRKLYSKDLVPWTKYGLAQGLKKKYLFKLVEKKYKKNFIPWSNKTEIKNYFKNLDPWTKYGLAQGLKKKYLFLQLKNGDKKLIQRTYTLD